MADKTDDKTDNDPDPKAVKEAEDAFWAEHEKRTRGILDKWFADETAKSVKAGGSTARNGGRRTLPKIIDDIMSAGLGSR